MGTVPDMARAIWSGSISFGLVNVPVKLYSAVSRKTVRFHQLDSKDNARIQQKRVNPNSGDEVPYEQLVKGFELSPDHYIVISPDELDALAPRKTKSIDIEDFVELDEIDPIYYDHPYYLAPAQGAGKAYALLVRAMEEANRVGIARVVIRSKEQLVAIRPHDGILMMETMLFGDEIVPPSDLGDMPALDEFKVSEKEVGMARQLIESLSTDFDPTAYKDEYREQVLDMIERKADGEEIVAQPEAEEPAEVPDLMAALEASIASAKRQSGGGGKDEEKPAKAKAKAKPKTAAKAKAKPKAKSKAAAKK
jgi:DNA end-binding protein Ku